VETKTCCLQKAYPNQVGVFGRFCWHSIKTIDEILCPKRIEKDFVYILQNVLPKGGANEPACFVVRMLHETLHTVTSIPLASFVTKQLQKHQAMAYQLKLQEIETKIEVGRLFLQAKKEKQLKIQRKIDLKEKTQSNIKIHHQKDQFLEEEWEKKLKNSKIIFEWNDWQKRETIEENVFFYYSLNDLLKNSQRFQWQPPSGFPNQQENTSSTTTSITSGSTKFSQQEEQKEENNENDDDDDDDDDDNNDNDNDSKSMDIVAKNLLEDEKFLALLKEKLGLLDQSKKQHIAIQEKKEKKEKEEEEEEDVADEMARIDLQDQMQLLLEEPNPSKASFTIKKMAKLQLSAYKPNTFPMINPGEGWKRLKKTKLPKHFARKVYSCAVEGPKVTFVLFCFILFCFVLSLLLVVCCCSCCLYDHE
jgi:hypothetical protein